VAMGDAEVLYKLASAADVPNDAWSNRLGWTQAYVGDGQESKFIRLFTAEQLAGVAEASFAGKSDVMLLSFTVETMLQEADLKVKFEGGDAQIHGGVIPYACLHAPPVLLELAEDGKHFFPLMGLGAKGLAGGDEGADEENSATDDGLEAFDQHRFDEDD